MAMNDPKTINTNGSKEPQHAPVTRPNEAGTIRVEAHMRIFDPKTGHTILEGRA